MRMHICKIYCLHGPYRALVDRSLRPILIIGVHERCPDPANGGTNGGTKGSAVGSGSCSYSCSYSYSLVFPGVQERCSEPLPKCRGTDFRPPITCLYRYQGFPITCFSLSPAFLRLPTSDFRPRYCFASPFTVYRLPAVPPQ